MTKLEEAAKEYASKHHTEIIGKAYYATKTVPITVRPDPQFKVCNCCSEAFKAGAAFEAELSKILLQFMEQAVRIDGLSLVCQSYLDRYKESGVGLSDDDLEHKLTSLIYRLTDRLYSKTNMTVDEIINEHEKWHERQEDKGGGA